MSREVLFSNSDYAGVRPLYFVIFNNSLLQFVVNTLTRMLEPTSAGSWTSYAVPLVLANGIYAGDFPALTAGSYYVQIFEQLSASPASNDNLLAAGTICYSATGSQRNAEQLALDARSFFGEWSEPITYKQGGDAGTALAIDAIVNRNPPSVVTEDGKVLTDDLEINIFNDPIRGVTKIVPERDTIIVSGRFGGVPTSHLVTMVVNGDAGMWTLRAK
jgi:hypothetical protein